MTDTMEWFGKSGEHAMQRIIVNSKRFLVAMAIAMLATFSSAQVTATSQLTLSSSFSGATGVALDPIGNLYVSDSTGTLSKFIGANGSGSTLLSTLTTPGQVAVDASRNLYVADGTSNVVYKYPYSNNSLSLNSPSSLGSGLGTVTGVAVDLSGNIFIVDNSNKQVVKIVGSTQTVLISGLTSPSQIAVDLAGNVYVADPGANAVVYLASGSTTPSTIGTGLNAPYGVAVDLSNNVYIADTGNNAIKEIPYSSGAPVTSSQTTLGVAVTAPMGLTLDTRGTLYIANGSSVIRYSSGAVYFGLLDVNSTSATTTVTVNFTSSLTPATIKVVTAGQTGYDFNDAGTGTCSAGTTYAAGNSCTVDVTVRPVYAGPRAGAIVFYSSSNTVLARVFLGGGGLGPVLTFDPGTISAPSTTVGTGITVSGPLGLKYDPLGNLFFADLKNNRVVELSAGGTASVALSGITVGDDIAINGAGDLIVLNTSTSGAVTLYPYENGSWSSTDATTLVSSIAKPRIVNVDVAGNMFTCDTTNNKIYEISTSGTQTQLKSGLTTACLGVAVDLYGNLAVSDSSAKVVYYVPANGTSAYSLAPYSSAPWGVVFDASGSVIIGYSGYAGMYRVPNENGSLVVADSLAVKGNKAYGITADPAGNVALATYYGSTVPTYYNYVSRSSSSTTFATSVAVGDSSATKVNVAVTLSNAGNQSPEYTESGGLLQLGDVDDFSLSADLSSTPTYSACDFSDVLQPGFQCYLAVGFSPTSPGATRTETIEVPSQGVSTPVFTITGTSSGTAASTASGLALSITSPTSNPYPTESLTVKATAAAAATGAVTLSVDGTATAQAELSSGAAGFTLSSGLSAGTHTLSATYAGDSTYAPISSGVSVSVTVVKITPSLTLSASGSQLNTSQELTLTANIATETGYAAPTGTATFYDGTTSLGSATVSSGIATFTTSSLSTGTHTLTYYYSGDSIYGTGTSSSATVIVGNYTISTTSLTLSPVIPTGGYSYGTSVKATAVVAAESGSATPSGSVVFSLDGTVQTISLSNGSASITIAPGAGSHTLSASYAGDTTFASSSASTSFTTVKATTTTSLSTTATAIMAGVNVTYTASVSSSSTTPTGTVTFMNGAETLGTATLSSGVATLTASSLPAGTDSVYAIYAGNSNCSSSTSSATSIVVTINPTTLSVTSVPVIVYSGTTPTITITTGYTQPSGSSKVPSGTVTLYANGTEYGTASLGSGGTADFKSVSLSEGVNVLTASYAGDNYYAASSTTSSYSIYVAPSSGWDGDYSIKATPDPLTVTIGSTGTLTITLTPSDNYYGYVQINCSGLPAYTTCGLETNQVTLDGTGTAVSTTMTIHTTSAGSLAMNRKKNLVETCGLALFPLIVVAFTSCFRRGRKTLYAFGAIRTALLVILISGMGLIPGCGSHVPLQTIPGTYTVTINATGSGSMDHTYSMQMTFK